MRSWNDGRLFVYNIYIFVHVTIVQTLQRSFRPMSDPSTMKGKSVDRQYSHSTPQGISRWGTRRRHSSHPPEICRRRSSWPPRKYVYLYSFVVMVNILTSFSDEEPLVLKESRRRFVLFPIQYHEVSCVLVSLLLVDCIYRFGRCTRRQKPPSGPWKICTCQSTTGITA